MRAGDQGAYTSALTGHAVRFTHPQAFCMNRSVLPIKAGEITGGTAGCQGTRVAAS